MGALLARSFHGLTEDRSDPYFPRSFQMLIDDKSDPYCPRSLQTELAFVSTQFRHPRKVL
jgi:hypothetical protein